MKKSLILAAIACLLGACAVPFRGGPNQVELDTADCGPVPVDFEKEIRSWLNDYLKDPESARIDDISEPKRAWWGQTGALLQPRIINYGWVVSARVNAKNSYGGYVGRKTYWFYFHDGVIKYTQSEK